MFLIVILVLIVTIVTWYQLNYRHHNLLLSKIPSPTKLPLIHNSNLLIGKSPRQIFQTFESLKNELGPVYQLTLTPFDVGSLWINDPKVVEGILSSNKLLDKTGEYDRISVWLGNGLLTTSNAKKWHQRRKIITPSFHFQILEKFVEIMDEQTKVLISKLEKLDGREVDIFPLANHFALDIICESAMGYKLNAQNSEDSDYVKAVKGMSEIILFRAYNAFLRSDFFYSWTSLYQSEKKYLKILHGFTDSVIKARRDELLNNQGQENVIDSTGGKKKKALLDILLQSTVDGAPLTNEDIREEVDTFMFAGHDTTTSGITFCLYNIAKHPEVQQKVLEEIQSEISSDKVLTIQDLNNLHYLELVIKESLRLYPSVPYYGRKLSEDVNAGGYTFPKNCNLNFSPYLMGRDPKIFTDPLVFNPNRFEVETTSDKINPYAYIPFSAGPRNCIGQKFAVYQIKTVVCRIIKNFELSISKENENLPLYSDLILKSEGGVPLKIKKRD